MKWLLFILPFNVFSQTITLTPIGNQDVSGIPVSVEHQITTGNGVTSVRVFRTHYGNGNTSQYRQYPSTRTEMNKLFNAAYAATTLWWTGNLNATTSLNFTNYGTLTNAGASIPSGGNYYATEVTFTFVPLETGLYYFGMTSDDGSDLSINLTAISVMMQRVPSDAINKSSILKPLLVLYIPVENKLPSERIPFRPIT